MPSDFPSAEWAAAYKDAINANPGYKRRAKDWTHGAVAMVVKADAGARHRQRTWRMWLDVHGASAGTASSMPATEAQDAPFVIVAAYARWKEVIRKELDPTKGMMQNKLKLTKGHMPTMVKYVTASKELVESTSRVPTQFVDE